MKGGTLWSKAAQLIPMFPAAIAFIHSFLYCSVLFWLSGFLQLPLLHLPLYGWSPGAFFYLHWRPPIREREKKQQHVFNPDLAAFYLPVALLRHLVILLLPFWQNCL